MPIVPVGREVHPATERDYVRVNLRASGAVCAPFLSAVAARVVLLACLGARLDQAGIAATFAPWDAGGGA